MAKNISILSKDFFRIFQQMLSIPNNLYTFVPTMYDKEICKT